MKKILSIIASSAAALLALTSCVNGAKEITEPEYRRVLAPTSLEATVAMTGSDVVFSWTKSKGASHFELEIYSDPSMSKSSLVESVLVPVAKVPYTHALVADEVYYFRVRGVDEENILPPSNWTVYLDSKTEEPKAIKTYAIKPSAEPVVFERGTDFVTLSLTLPKGDTEVTHILVKTASGKEEEFPVESIVDSKVTVTGLNPSTFYSLTVHFKSANRGSVVAWTRPLVDGTPTVIKDTAHFKQAVKDGATVIEVPYADTTYVMGEIAAKGDLFIYGVSSPTGAKPVIAGRVTGGADITSLRLEDLSFSGAAVKANSDGTGGMSLQTHLFTVSKACSMTKVEFININVEGYERGLYYDNNGGNVSGKIVFDGVRSENILGSGGDNIDIRNAASAASELVIKNSTFNGGTRTFLRLDANAQIKKVTIESNTFNNMCYNGGSLVIGGSNVQGILAVKATACETFTVKNNLFLNNQCWLVGQNSACKVPVFEKNYVFNSAAQFYTSAKLDDSGARSDMGKAVVLGGDGLELISDPTQDSMGGLFNVKDNLVLKAKVGDPRWFQPYVYVPEDLTLNVTEAVHTWDFSNAKTFYKKADVDMVRDGIRFYIGAGLPVLFEESSLIFQDAAVLGMEEPFASAIGIKVNAPGSLVISSEAVPSFAPAGIVIYKGQDALSAVATGAKRAQVLVSDVEPGVETMLYICPTTPCAITELQWNAETALVTEPALATPVVKLSAAKATQGDEVTLTIDPVAHAASYAIRIDGGNAGTTKDLEYVIKTGSLSVGEHTISVVAVPAEEDMLREASEPAQAGLEIKEKPAPTPGGTAGKIVFDEYVGNVPASIADGSITLAINNGGSKIAIDANTCYFAPSDPVKYTTRLKTGGKSGSSNGLTVSVESGASGKLKIAVRTGSNSATDRSVVITKDGSELVNHVLLESEKTSGVVIPGEADPKDVYPYIELDVTEGDYVITYPVNGINFYGFEFTPASAPGPQAESKSWVFASEDWQTELAKMGESGKDLTGTWNITIDGLNYSASKSRWTNKCIQVTQDGRADGNGVFTFTALAAGTVTVSASGTGSTPEGDRNVVIKTDGASEQVSTNCNVPSNGDPATATFTVSAGEQKIYVTGALRIYSISYDPAK